jgi:hypothetical protein
MLTTVLAVTTCTSVFAQAKMDSGAVLSLAFFQQMSKAVGLTFAAQV